MSKRKNRAPNLPQETLDRARRQASGEAVDPTPEEEPEAPVLSMPVSRPAPVASTPRRSSEREELLAPRRSQPERIQYSRRERKDAPLTPEMIQAALANPTKIVTEEQLHEEYGFVLRDLQSMGILSLILIFVLIALAQFI